MDVNFSKIKPLKVIQGKWCITNDRNTSLFLIRNKGWLITIPCFPFYCQQPLVTYVGLSYVKKRRQVEYLQMATSLYRKRKKKKNKKKEIQLHLKISNKPSLLGFDGGSSLSLRVALKRASGIFANYSTSLPEKRNFMKFLPSGTWILHLSFNQKNKNIEHI